MKFSVIIPCYNAERWIEQTLESVANQTLSAYEIIVVDDGSTDNSRDRIQGSSIPITLLQTQRLGPGAARNRGIAAATGDWIAFLDADDWWQPNHLERVQALLSNTDDVVYLAAAEHYSLNVNRVVSLSDNGPLTQPTNQLDHTTYFELYLKHGLLELSSMVVRLARLKEVGSFDPQMSGAEDFDLMLRVVYGKTWAYDPVPSTVYRCNNPDSYSQKSATNELSLTAKFRTLLKNRDCYPVSEQMMQGIAKTIMSKAITECEVEARKAISALTRPYLSKSQKIIFTLANFSPNVYKLLNMIRNKIKGPSYAPRRVVPPAS
ncbi:MAG: glycosyltransferase family 2 protein [Symploca sp. SIO1A3]|nr:glycosyltransferase family 2 protein [Symploca sp. SIO1A3]